MGFCFFFTPDQSIPCSLVLHSVYRLRLQQVKEAILYRVSGFIASQALYFAAGRDKVAGMEHMGKLQPKEKKEQNSLNRYSVEFVFSL